MKPKRKQSKSVNQKADKKPIIQGLSDHDNNFTPLLNATLPAELTPEQKRQNEIEELLKFKKYSIKYGEFEKAFQKDSKYKQTVSFIEELMEQERWYSENTPIPFKSAHWSHISKLAFLTCTFLKELALADNQDAINILGFLTVEMTEALTEILIKGTKSSQNNAKAMEELKSKYNFEFSERATKSNTELLKRTARAIPYWPMLRFKNTRANEQTQFIDLADQLELGQDCWINVSKTANYSLDTPINSFVWKCLRHFQNCKWIIQHSQLWSSQSANYVAKLSNKPIKTFDEAIEEYLIKKVESPTTGQLKTVGLISREEIPIFKEIEKLPELTKSTARQWADKAIMPYVKIKFQDLRKVPELKAYKTGKDGKSYAAVRLAIIQALEESLAKDDVVSG